MAKPDRQRRGGRRQRVWLFAVVLLLVSGLARAEQQPDVLCTLPAKAIAVPGAPRNKRPSLRVVQGHIDQATRAYKNERYLDALYALRLAYALHPRPDILFNLAQSCRELGQPAAAVTMFAQVVKEAVQGELHDAAQRNEAELRDSLVRRADEQGRRLLEEKKYSEAIAAWEGAFALLPWPVLLFRIAQAERLRGEPEAARRTYERFLRLDPESEFKAEATAHLAHLRGEALDAEAQRNVKEQRYGQAIAAWDGAYRVDALPLYLYRRAEVEQKAGLWREALASYERFLAADPQTPLRAEVEQSGKQLRARLLDEEANHLFAQKSYAQASRIWAEAEALNHRSLHQFQRAEAARHSGQPEVARALYERFLGQDPPPEYRALAAQYIVSIDTAQELARRAGERQKPRPLHRRWWLWTSVAAAVAVGVVASVVVATQVTLEPSYPNLRIVHLPGALHGP